MQTSLSLIPLIIRVPASTSFTPRRLRSPGHTGRSVHHCRPPSIHSMFKALRLPGPPRQQLPTDWPSSWVTEARRWDPRQQPRRHQLCYRQSRWSSLAANHTTSSFTRLYSAHFSLVSCVILNVCKKLALLVLLLTECKLFRQL